MIAVERKIARLLPTGHPLSIGMLASKFARDDLKIQMNAKQRQDGEGGQGHQKIEAKSAHCRAFSSLTALKVKEPVHATLG